MTKEEILRDYQFHLDSGSDVIVITLKDALLAMEDYATLREQEAFEAGRKVLGQPKRFEFETYKDWMRDRLTQPKSDAKKSEP